MAYLHQSENWDVEHVRTAASGEAIAFKRACLYLSASKTVIKTTADTDIAVGLSSDSYDTGVQCEYIEKGDLRFVSGGIVTMNDPLCPDEGTAGRIRTAISGDRIVGYALEAVSQAGEFGLGRFDFVSSTLLV